MSSKFTNREEEIFKAYILYNGFAEIGEKLHISNRTVETHKRFLKRLH